MQDLLTAAIVGITGFTCLYLAAGFALFVCDRLTQPHATINHTSPVPAPIEPPTPPAALEQAEPALILTPADTQAIDQLLALQPAEPQIAEAVAPTRTPNITALRKQCSQAGIKWRNAHGKHKHLSSTEMLLLLA